MATLKDYRDERIRKLNELRAEGIEPYPAHTNRNTKIGDILKSFDKYVEQPVCIAGRIDSIRSFGKLAFVVVEDDSGHMQVVLKDAAAKFTKKLDTGDFLEAAGTIGKTQTGEISVFCDQPRILTKALRPLPGRDGFTNKEERLRRQQEASVLRAAQREGERRGLAARCLEALCRELERHRRLALEGCARAKAEQRAHGIEEASCARRCYAVELAAEQERLCGEFLLRAESQIVDGTVGEGLPIGGPFIAAGEG